METIGRHRMLHAGDAILIGVSGGPDSMALLHGLVKMAGSLGVTLGVAHLNHCLRKTDANRDEMHVRQTAEQLNLRVFIEKKEILSRKTAGMSLEETARNIRYDFFDTICRQHGFTKIAVAHQADDNAEQVLLNILRGSGTAGMAGIPPVRGNIIRPLIQISRAEILEFLAAGNIGYVTDASNSDTRFLRNKIRHQLLPLLAHHYNPQISSTLNRMSGLARADEEWMNTLVASLYEKACLRKNPHEVLLSTTELQALHPAARRRVIRKGIFSVKHNLTRILNAHIAAVLCLLQNNRENRQLDLPDQIRIIRKNQVLIIRKELKNLRHFRGGTSAAAANCDPFEYRITRPEITAGNPVFIAETNQKACFDITPRHRIPDVTAAGAGTAFFDWDMLEFPLIIRNIRAGDRFTPLGMTGSQKLKKFFINQKIPRDQRHRIPLLVSRGRIVWVGGIRTSDEAKIMPQTRTVLSVTLSAHSLMAPPSPEGP